MRRLTLAFLCLAVSAAAPASADKTERTWKAKCASCHGDDGKGDTKKGKEMGVKDMSTAAWQKSKTDAQLKEGTENGVAEKVVDGKKQQMDAYKDKLKPEQITDLVAYMRSLAAK